jgi:hypothetical protein
MNADQIIFFFYINFFFTLPSQILLNKKNGSYIERKILTDLLLQC